MLTNLRFLPVEIDIAINLAPKTGKSSCSKSRFLTPPVAPVCYCAIANMPPANECHSGDTLIGQFRNFTAISAMPP